MSERIGNNESVQLNHFQPMTLSWDSLENRDDSEKTRAELLYDYEMRMKSIWSQYINYIESNGYDDNAKTLKQDYFRIYERYKKNKKWLQAFVKS